MAHVGGIEPFARPELIMIFYFLSVAAITLIISKSKIFYSLRIWIEVNSEKPLYAWLYELVACPLCLGVHVGWMLLLLDSWTTLYDFTLLPLDYFLLSVSAGLITLLLYSFIEHLFRD